MTLGFKDINLRNYIGRFDLPEEYAARNEGGEMCFNYVSKLMARIEYYKEAAFLDLTGALKNKRSKQTNKQMN